MKESAKCSGGKYPSQINLIMISYKSPSLPYLHHSIAIQHVCLRYHCVSELVPSASSCQMIVAAHLLLFYYCTTAPTITTSPFRLFAHADFSIHSCQWCRHKRPNTINVQLGCSPNSMPLNITNSPTTNSYHHPLNKW